MKRWLMVGILGAAMAAGCVVGPQGSGVERSESRDVGEFTSLSLEGAYLVDVTCGAPRSVVISGDDNLVPKVLTDVQNQTLHVHQDKPMKSRLPLLVKIAVPSLDAVTLSGAVTGTVRGIKANEFHVDMSGVGSLEMSGTVDSLRVTSSGVASLFARNLHSQKAKVTISGTGSAQVYATDSLDADISGAGSIEYGGDPKTVHPSVSGVGSIKKL